MYRLRDVCDDAYRVPAARSFMCKGEALLRLTMRCQCYAERERQLKVADRLVKPRAVELRPAAICDSAAEELPSTAKGGLMSAVATTLLRFGGGCSEEAVEKGSARFPRVRLQL